MASTKRITHDANFSRSSTVNPEGALAFMVMAAFGVSLDQITAIVNKIIADKDSKVATLCIAAAIQIRGNVTFVTSNYANVRSNYPNLIIDSLRDTGDQFNFSALHVTGHVICLASGNSLGAKILSKVGNCVNGSTFPSNAAGKINSELKNSWSPDELKNFDAWMRSLTDDGKKVLNNFLDGVSTKASAFGATLSSGAPSTSASAPTVPRPSKPAVE